MRYANVNSICLIHRPDYWDPLTSVDPQGGAPSLRAGGRLAYTRRKGDVIRGRVGHVHNLDQEIPHSRLEKDFLLGHIDLTPTQLCRISFEGLLLLSGARSALNGILQVFHT